MANITSNATNLEYKCTRKTTTLFSFGVAVLASPVYILMLKILICGLKLNLPRHKILLSLTISDSIQIVVFSLLQLSVLQARVTSIGCQIIRKIMEFSGILTIVSSSGSIIFLSIERYVACVHCLRFHEIITDKLVNRLLGCIWTFSFICGFFDKKRYEESLSPAVLRLTETTAIIYTGTVLSSSVVLLVVQVRLYFLSYRKMKVGPGDTAFGQGAEEVDTRKTQIKVAVVASAIVIMYMVCMCPLAFYLLSTSFESRRDPTVSRRASIMLASVNTLMDPFVYGLGMADTREEIKRQLKEIKSILGNLLPNASKP